MIESYKIYAFERPVSALADNPAISAGKLKEHFDSNSYELKDALNGVIDDLTSENGAENIGFGDSNIKGVLENFKSDLTAKVDKVDGKGLSSNDFTDENKQKLEGIYSRDEIEKLIANKAESSEVDALYSDRKEVVVSPGLALSLQEIGFVSYSDNILTLTAEDEFFENNDVFAFRIANTQSKVYVDLVKVESSQKNGDNWEFEIETPREELNLSVPKDTEILAIIKDETVAAEAQHASGNGSYSIGNIAHATGKETLAADEFTHTEGWGTVAIGRASHAEGYNTKVIENYGHAEGAHTIAGYCAHAEGSTTQALAQNAHSEGHFTKATGQHSHSEGAYSEASGHGSHAEGGETLASGEHSHAEGFKSTAEKKYAHAEGQETKAAAEASHTEGQKTKATGLASHAEGQETKATGVASHAEGGYAEASGIMSHSEGRKTSASGNYAHAEGENTKASGLCSHAEGSGSVASNRMSHAEGYNTKAPGDMSHSEGRETVASGECSHAEGRGTIASKAFQHVQGKYNQDGNYAHIVGNGNSDTDRKNIHTLDWSGNAWFAGNVIANGVNLSDKLSELEANGGIPTLNSLEEADDIEEGIYLVKRYASENNDFLGYSTEFSGGYGILICTYYITYDSDGIYNEDGYYQVLYDWTGMIKKRENYARQGYGEWVQYVAPQSILQQGSISSVSGNVTSYEFSANIKTAPTKAYKIEHTTTSVIEFNFADVDSSRAGFVTDLKIYFKANIDSAIVWGDNVGFVGDVIPTIEANTNYRILAEYNPIMKKWVIEVICDGTDA